MRFQGWRRMFCETFSLMSFESSIESPIHVRFSSCTSDRTLKSWRTQKRKISHQIVGSRLLISISVCPQDDDDDDDQGKRASERDKSVKKTRNRAERRVEFFWFSSLVCSGLVGPIYAESIGGATHRLRPCSNITEKKSRQHTTTTAQVFFLLISLSSLSELNGIWGSRRIFIESEYSVTLRSHLIYISCRELREVNKQ